jgi:hypothetical protein
MRAFAQNVEWAMMNGFEFFRVLCGKKVGVQTWITQMQSNMKHSTLNIFIER